MICNEDMIHLCAGGQGEEAYCEKGQTVAGASYLVLVPTGTPAPSTVPLPGTNRKLGTKSHGTGIIPSLLADFEVKPLSTEREAGPEARDPRHRERERERKRLMVSCPFIPTLRLAYVHPIAA